MMEPWEDPTSGDGARHLCGRFVCRVSGAPSDTVDGLRATRTLAVLDRLGAVEARLQAERENLSALLFQAIGGASDDKPRRNRLITLKRELYNLRPASQSRLDEALAGMGDEEAGRVRAFQADLEERRRLEDEARSTLSGETAELRGRFGELLKDADFRKGLMISSRSLYAYVDRYRPVAELSGKEEKTERGLLRYFTRTAMKATPFSTFCAIIPGTFVEDDGGELIRFEGHPRSKRSYVRVNKLLYGILLEHLKERPGVRHALVVEPNPTIRLENGRLVFLTALQGREVFQRLAPNEVLDLIASRFRGGKPTLGDLIATLSADPQIDATPEEAEAYLDKLLEIGFLRYNTGIREQDADWDVPFRALLDRIDDDHARQSSELLVRVREKTDAYAGAGVEERAAIIQELHALINDAFEGMEVKGRLRRDMPFYEDATADAHAEVPLTPAVKRTVDAFSRWARLTMRLAWPRAEQATMRHFFDTYYTEARSVPLLKFYEDFYREHFKSHVEKEAKIRAGVDREELKDYNVGNPFALEFINRLSAARNRMNELVQGRWRENPEAESLSITAAEVEEALQGVETEGSLSRSVGAFTVLAPPEQPGGDPLLVLQGSSYTAGYGKYFSRFLYMLPGDMQEAVRVDNAALTGELLAEICGDAQFNANLHPPLLRWEISYPTGEGGATEEQILSAMLLVEPDPDDPNSVRLRHGPTGKRVIPVDLGFLNPRMRPPLYQLLSRFTPPVTFAPSIPETPFQRQQPAPQAAAEGQQGEGRQGDGQQGDGPQGDGQQPQGEGQPAVDQPAAQPVADQAAGDAQPAAAAPSPAEAKADGDVKPAGDAPAAEGAAPAPTPATPRISVRPRLVFEDRLVLARRRWNVPGALFPQRGADESAADFFIRAARWREENGIPETCYIRIVPTSEAPAPRPGQPAGEAGAPAEQLPEPDLPGYDAPAGPEAEDHEDHEGEAAAEPPAAAAEGQPAEGEGAPAADGQKQPPRARTAPSRDFYKPQFMDFGNPLLVGLLGKMAANLKSYSAVVEERLPAREGLPTLEGETYTTELVMQLYFPEGVASAPAAAEEEEHASVG